MKKLTRENKKAESDKQRSQPLKERKVKKNKLRDRTVNRMGKNFEKLTVRND